MSWAAWKGHTDIVKLLIENGADVNEKNALGWTPLGSAAYFGYTDVVKLLIEKGADIDVSLARLEKFDSEEAKVGI